MDKAKGLKLLLFILLVAFILRIPAIDHFIFNDEFYPSKIIGTGDLKKIFLSHESGHPPFYIAVNYFFTLLFGDHTYTFRLASLFFAMLNMTLVYFIAKREFGEKAALIASLVMAASAWFVIGSTQIHIDAPFVMFFYLLITLLFLRYQESGRTIDLFWMGIAFIFALLTKETSVLIIPIIMSFIFFRSKEKLKIRQYVKPLLVFLVGIIIFAGFMLSAAKVVQDTSTQTVNVKDLLNIYVFGKTSPEKYDFKLLLAQYMLALILATPLLIGLLILPLLNFDRRYLPYLFWIAAIFCFYTFFISGFARSFERWLITTVPAIAIIGANYISGFEIKKKHVGIFAGVFAACLMIFMLLNHMNAETLPFYPKTEYFSRVANLDWNINLPISGNAGPIGFYLSLPSILVSFLSAAAIIILMIVFNKNRNISTTLLVSFLGISLAFNLLIIEEHSFGLLNTDVNKVSWELTDWAKTADLKEPIYIFRNFAIVDYYLKPYYKQISSIDFDHENDMKKIDEINQGKGTVLVVDFPAINKESRLWKMLQGCSTLKIFEDKGQPAGYAFAC